MTSSLPTREPLRIPVLWDAVLRFSRRMWAALLGRPAAAPIHGRALADGALAARASHLAAVAQRLHTPLVVIRELAIALEARVGDPEAGDLARLIGANSAELLALASGLADIGALQSDTLELRPAPFCPVEVADQLVASARERDEERVIALDIGDVPFWVEADPIRWTQVVEALLDNAVRHGGSGDVHLALSQRGGLRCTLTDHGPGIGSARLAELFHALDWTERPAERPVPVGLALCRGIAEKMGGTLEVESVLGLGTTVHFTVPVAEIPAADEADDEDPTLSDASRVLVADDDPVRLMEMVVMLERLGIDAVGATSGKDALALLHQSLFDLVLLDVGMANMDGLEVTQRIRGVGFEIPVVGMSLGATPSEHRRCLKIGMDAVLAKPIKVNAIRAMLRKFCPAQAA